MLTAGQTVSFSLADKAPSGWSILWSGICGCWCPCSVISKTDLPFLALASLCYYTLKNLQWHKTGQEVFHKQTAHTFEYWGGMGPSHSARDFSMPSEKRSGTDETLLLDSLQLVS